MHTHSGIHSYLSQNCNIKNNDNSRGIEANNNDLPTQTDSNSYKEQDESAIEQELSTKRTSIDEMLQTTAIPQDCVEFFKRSNNPDLIAINEQSPLNWRQKKLLQNHMLQLVEAHIGLQTDVNSEEQSEVANPETIILPLIPQWTHSWGHKSNLTKPHDTSSSLFMENMVILDEYYDNNSLSEPELPNSLTQKQESEQSYSPKVKTPMPVKYAEPSHSQYNQDADSNGDSNGRACLHIPGLQENVSKTNLKAVFGHYGKVTYVWIARSKNNYAFIKYLHKKDAQGAQRQTNGIHFQGRNIRVTMAISNHGVKQTINANPDSPHSRKLTEQKIKRTAAMEPGIPQRCTTTIMFTTIFIQKH